MKTQSSPIALRARGITTKLGSHQILAGLTMPDLYTGHLVTLLGPNGSGKSTLLKSIAGLIHSHSQTLTLGNDDLCALDASARAATVRYLPQTLPGDVHLTVIEAMLVALNARGSRPADDAMRRIESTLKDLGIAHLAHRYLDELSGGQKQLVGLAQALSHAPTVLLLDEPLASLDLNYQHHVMQLLMRLTHERNLLTLIVVHDVNIALRYADDVLLMCRGELITSGPAAQAITPETLARTFSVRARIETCSQGQPYVIVDDLSAPPQAD